MILTFARRTFQSILDALESRRPLVRRGRSRTSARRPSRFRPLFEPLEARTVLSATLWSDLADAVNYRTIKKQVLEFVESSSYLLVERLANEVARLCLADERVTAVQVTLDKPGALRYARSVGVTIRRTRQDM